MKRPEHLVILIFLAAAMIASGLAGEDQGKASRGPALNPAAVKAINEMGTDLEKLNESHRRLVKAIGGLDDLYLKLIRKAQEVSRLAADAEKTRGKAVDKLFQATREMQEMQQSFNLQYLDLQNEISHENRQFTLVSNILKTKHDTAKNSINNIR